MNRKLPNDRKPPIEMRVCTYKTHRRGFGQAQPAPGTREAGGGFVSTAPHFNGGFEWGAPNRGPECGPEYAIEWGLFRETEWSDGTDR